MLTVGFSAPCRAGADGLREKFRLCGHPAKIGHPRRSCPKYVPNWRDFFPQSVGVDGEPGIGLPFCGEGPPKSPHADF